MLKGISPLISPELLQTLDEMGHGDTIILSDAHFPAGAMGIPVLRADGLGIAPLLDAILPLFELDSYVPSPVVMMAPVPGDTLDQSLLDSYRAAIEKHAPETPATEFVERFAFYERAKKAFAVVVTGETGKYGNIILSKGVTPVSQSECCCCKDFATKKAQVMKRYNALITRKNKIDNTWYNGCFHRYVNPVVTNEMIPPAWKFDFNPATNPYFMERMGVNAVLNAGAILFNGKISLVCRVEGNDRKSFFAVADSETGIDGFQFREKPILLPETSLRDTNVYDMRLTQHEDGWIYGLFCSERKDPGAKKGDESSAVAACGIVRTKDLETWERLDDLVTPSPQQRNVVLHPEFIDGKYAFYTRPQDGFIDAGTGGGIGWGLSTSIEHAKLDVEKIVDQKIYHTIKEVKNGCGAPPIKTADGWLHIAHGVRNTAAGLRYVLYAFLCDLKDPSKVIASPGGFFLAPYNQERIGDVSNVVFCNGLVTKENGDIFLYYASSDTRMHVATTTVEKLLDWVKNTPEDPLYSHDCVAQRIALIESNKAFL